MERIVICKVVGKCKVRMRGRRVEGMGGVQVEVGEWWWLEGIGGTGSKREEREWRGAERIEHEMAFTREF